ncbi:hypothetical protein DWB61_06010 [Ancylomarina euxinus]|uniref:Uncharacterized protein n=2 Tax=Ancylomarina euxinus TaxID=2283627 RepID=A0A425Y3Y6_9BACT|nr:hypothetical protein DWB61_06010 [Ancylomarina euxinus]
MQTLIDTICIQDALFESDELFEICLNGNIRELFKDRRDDASYHPILLTYKLASGKIDSLNIRVKTRGNFRRKRENCKTPPLLLNFDSVQIQSNDLFAGQGKIKLVTPCVDHKYVLREYLIYKVYQLISANSFNVRLVKLCFEDAVKGKMMVDQYSILLENQNILANRLRSQLFKRVNTKPQRTIKQEFLNMAVFQYLIGNTDWSIQYRHNIKLIHIKDKNGLISIPYDFDHAGLVNAPYAKPAEELQMNTVRQRRYRGYCIEDMREFQPTFDLFNSLKADIYAIYTNNFLLEESYLKQTLKYLDEFYQTINNPKMAAKAFQYPCDPRGTGNVVIKGLK